MKFAFSEVCRVIDVIMTLVKSIGDAEILSTRDSEILGNVLYTLEFVIEKKKKVEWCQGNQKKDFLLASRLFRQPSHLLTSFIKSTKSNNKAYSTSI